MSDGDEKNIPLLHFLQIQSLILLKKKILLFLIVPFCDWELLQVVLGATNEELAGKNTERTSSGGREREREGR